MRIRHVVLHLAIFLLLFLWLTDGGSMLFDRSSDEEEQYYRADGRYLGPPVEREGLPNLIVIVVDALRADCLGADEGEPGDMPYLLSLARTGVRCTQVTAAAPATYPSITTLLTGLLPDEHGVDHTPDPPRLPAGITTYAEALGRGHGYDTAAYLQVPLSAEPNAPLQGFQTALSPAPLHAWQGTIETWNRERVKRKPFFLFLHTYEAHDPYGETNHPWPEPWPTQADVARAPALGKIGDAELVERFVTDRPLRMVWLEQAGREVSDRVFDYYGRGYASNPDPALAARIEGAYRMGVRWVDAQLQRAIAHLRAQGLLENTLLVVTSDHGEGFGEHGILNHGRTLHEELVHVPFVAVGPAPFDRPRMVTTSFGLIDVLPTFFEMAGLPPLGDTTGRSMLGAITGDEPGRAVLSLEQLTMFKMGRFANQKLCSARTAHESYLVRYDVSEGTIREALYDRNTDPEERRDLAAETGRIGTLPVSAALASAIERARDRIWTSVRASQQHLQLGYGAGVATVTSTRPAPARTR